MCNGALHSGGASGRPIDDRAALLVAVSKCDLDLVLVDMDRPAVGLSVNVAHLSAGPALQFAAEVQLNLRSAKACRVAAEGRSVRMRI